MTVEPTYGSAVYYSDFLTYAGDQPISTQTWGDLTTWGDLSLWWRPFAQVFTPAPNAVTDVKNSLWWVAVNQGRSLLKIDGTWVARSNPTQDDLAPLVEDATLFRGGYAYWVDPEMKAELIAAGVATEGDFT